MESTSPNFDHHHHHHHHQHHQQQPQPQHHHQQQHLQDSLFVGCSPLNSHPNYTLDWNPISSIFSSSGSSNSNEFLGSNGESRGESALSTRIPASMAENEARNLGYVTSNLPKIEEDMLTSFSNFSSLLNSNPSSNGMENQASWFNNGFPFSGAQYNGGFPGSSLLNQLGLVSSPNTTSVLSSGSAPRLGLNLEAMDLFGSNASFGTHTRASFDALGDEVISPAGKNISHKSTSAALMNGITGTKRAAGRSDQPKASTSTNSANSNKKSQFKVSCPPFKVRKEKLGDRIAALHELVSPFGKTDTASVLTEAIGYIQFLQDQIHTLCMPHAKPTRTKTCRPFQMGGGTGEEEGKEEGRSIELRRRGLCLVPLSWTSFITTTQLDASNQSFF